MNRLLPIILIIASLGLFLLYVNPTYTGATGSGDNGKKSVKELSALKDSYNDALNKTRQIEETRQGLLAKYNSLTEAQLDTINKLLPNQVDSIRLIIDINNVAAAYGMSLTNISLSGDSGKTGKSSSAGASSGPINRVPGSMPAGTQGGSEGGSETNYEPVQLSFSVSGSYEAFIGFMKELEQSLRIIDIVSLSLGPSSDKGQVSSSDKTKSSDTADASGGNSYSYGFTIATYHLK